MKEEIKEYVDDIVGEVYNEDLELKVCNDVCKIVTEYTKIPETSDNSCLVRCDSDGDNFELNVYYKDEDKNDLKYSLLSYRLTREDVEFNDIRVEND